ncbi:MAG: aldehyde dehydrogenase family protein [Nitrospinota bacterium]
MNKDYPILVGGVFKKKDKKHEIKAPYDGHTAGTTYLATETDIEEATGAAKEALAVTAKLAPHERSTILHKISTELDNRKEEISRVLSAEAGKPIKAARVEIDRSIFTFQYASEEARRITGEIIPLDASPHGAGHTCFVKRVPIGPILGIGPFNFPMNLVAHKVAPALASGNPIVIKPASQTPLTGLILAQIVMEAGWPKGGFSMIPTPPSLAEIMVKDDRFKMLSFTGSPGVGWRLKNSAGTKKIALELGGNAGVIVRHDADIEDAAARIAVGGFSYSGQTCISVQRILVHEKVYDRFKKLFQEKVKALKVGDPADEATDVGPLIYAKEADRVLEWINEAVEGGAKLLCGGAVVNGSVLEPTVLEKTTPDMKVACMEIFGPVVTLQPYDDIDDAYKVINESDFGLQAGIFTNDLKAAFRAWDVLDVGGINVGNVPTFRVDHMPYGGVKMSGLGREGIRYAIEEMTELRNLVINKL